MNTIPTLKNTLPALALLGLGLSGCQPDIDAPAPGAAGAANLSQYVAVGNSLTAGFQSGGLANAGIDNSYPAILSRQFALVGGGNFVLPRFDDGQKDGSGYLRFFGITSTGSPILLQPGQSTTVIVAGETAPRTITNNPADYKFAFTGNNLPVSGQKELAAFSGGQPDNLGVPGISVLSADATAYAAVNPAFPIPVATLTGATRAYSLINPYYQRILPAADRGTKDYVTFISQKNPTFFTCWMGNNDVLTYANNGAVLDAANPFSGLTDTTSFGRGYRNIVRTISKNGTVQGVVANIPNVTNVPYFTSVKLADVIANFKLQVNPAISAVYIREGSGTTVRAATESDLILLTAQGQFATGAGITPTNPLGSQYVLDPAEVTSILARTTQLNNIIAKTARQYKVPLADMNTFFNSVALNGIFINGTANNAGLIRGNLFSLDGVHPTSRGYAVIANEFIRVINANYGASVPQVNPNDYDAVLFP